MNSGVYTITNLVNGKMYVGFTSNFLKRKLEHFKNLRNNQHKNIHLQNAYNKYEKNNFIFEILEECEEKFLVNQEHYWCNLLSVHNRLYGYNISPTHPYNKYKVSKETRIKIRNKLKGRKLSLETIQKIIKSHKHLKNSIETKAKISRANKGKKFTNEHKLKLSQRIITDEWKRKLSEANKGRILNKNCKTVIQYNLNNEEINKFSSIVNAAKILKLRRCSIAKACNENSIYKNSKWAFKTTI